MLSETGLVKFGDVDLVVPGSFFPVLHGHIRLRKIDGMQEWPCDLECDHCESLKACISDLMLAEGFEHFFPEDFYFHRELARFVVDFWHNYLNEMNPDNVWFEREIVIDGHDEDFRVIVYGDIPTEKFVKQLQKIDRIWQPQIAIYSEPLTREYELIYDSLVMKSIDERLDRIESRYKNHEIQMKYWSDLVDILDANVTNKMVEDTMLSIITFNIKDQERGNALLLNMGYIYPLDSSHRILVTKAQMSILEENNIRYYVVI